jgi:tRNA modification GTPase
LLLVNASQGITPEDTSILDGLPTEIPRLLVYNKADLLTGNKAAIGDGIFPGVYVSAKTGEGLDLLQSSLLKAVGWRDQENGAFMARERHIRALNIAQTSLKQAQALLASQELFAEELRLAQRALDEITGKFTPDDLLGEIFSRFCIGK